MKYQPDQSIRDYTDWDIATSSVITGDFTTDSLKYGFGPTSLSAESSESKLREYEKTYGKAQAKIRMRLKNSIMKRETHGTKAGQWSARKSQLLKEEYEAACERAGLKPYKGSKTESQKNLSDWSDQDWRTASGGKSSKTGEPYFPAKAVAALKEKGLYAKAKRQKAAATKAGKQHADYSEDIEAVVKKYRSEESQQSHLLEWSDPDGEGVRWNTYKGWGKVKWSDEPWVTGERPEAAVQSEIAAGYHNDSYEDLGCPRCRNIDYFWKSTTDKGKKYRCMICEYTENWETVKTEGHITLEKFGLTVECPICGESISAYNKSSIRYHLKKHEPAEAAEEVLEAEDSDDIDKILKSASKIYKRTERGIKRNFSRRQRDKITQQIIEILSESEEPLTTPEIVELIPEKSWPKLYRSKKMLHQIVYTKGIPVAYFLNELRKEGIVIKANGEYTSSSGKTYPRATYQLKAESSGSDDYALVVGDLSDTEQLSIEIEDIDETYGLINLSEIETSVQEFAVNAAREMIEDYSDIIPCVAIVFVSETFTLDHVARYRSQTVGNCPIVMLSLSAIKDSAFEYDVPMNLAVATSVWHELGHALDEYCYDYLMLDLISESGGFTDAEVFAESFALWYSGFSSLAPPTQEQLFELSED